MPLKEATSVISTTRWSHAESTGEPDGNPGPTSVDTLVATDRVTLRKYRYGLNSHDWKERIRRHAQATNFLLATEDSYSPGGGFATIRYRNNSTLNTFGREISGGWVRATRPGNPDQLSVSQAQSNAKMTFLKKVYESQTEFQTGVFLKEFSKTLSLVRNPAHRLQNGLRFYLNQVKSSIVKGNRRASMNKASKLWLEGQFGWRQLYNDTLSGAKALAKANSEPWVRKIRVTGWGSDTESSNSGIGISFSPISLATTDFFLNQVSCEIVGAVKIQNRDGGRARQFGLFPENFVPTVWELIPYSWVVDYFTNVGDILNASAAHVGSIAWNSMTTKSLCRTETRVTADNTSLSSGLTELYRYMDLTPSIYERKRLVRTAVDDWSIDPFASLQFETPGANWVKWLNLGALLGANKHVSSLIARL